MADPSATAVLADVLGSAAPDHPATHLVTGLTVGDDPPLVVAVVGPSGVGKSSLVNALAGGGVTESGVLRPTSIRASEWEARDGSLRLVDAPPSDQMPGPGLTPLRSADLALVVTSQGRYADAATWACVRAVREEGLPMVLVVNRLGAAAEAIVDDLSERTDGEAVIAIGEGDLAGGVAGLRSLLSAAAAEPASVRALRKHLGAARAAAAVRSLALDTRIAGERLSLLMDCIADAAAAVTVDDGVLAAAAEGSRDDLVSLACSAIDDRATTATAPLVALWEDLGLPIPEVRGDAFRADDAAAIDRWLSATADAFTAATRPRWMRSLASPRVADQSWRLCVDRDRPPRGMARLTLGGRCLPLAAESRSVLARTLSDRVDARIGAFRMALPPFPVVDPDLLERLAAQLGDEHPPADVPAFLVVA